MENNVAPKPVIFNSFAVLDLETSNFVRECNNEGSIMELSIYGISTKQFIANCTKREQNVPELQGLLPKMPRVLHKLTQIVKPEFDIHPNIEGSTGLYTEMLEPESALDANAAESILCFLQHLPQPVCLVAHCGWGHDFPIVKQAFEKLQKKLPNNLICVDSLRAFLEIDEVHRSLLEAAAAVAPPIALLTPPQTPSKTLQCSVQYTSTPENASTLQYNPTDAVVSGVKRKLFHEPDAADELEQLFSAKRMSHVIVYNTPRRSLCFGAEASPLFKRYPPRGLYGLQNMYWRIFQQRPMYVHQAEADVKSLLLLMLHYGEDFVDYAEQHARPLSEVPSSGSYF